MCSDDQQAREGDGGQAGARGKKVSPDGVTPIVSTVTAGAAPGQVEPFKVVNAYETMGCKGFER